MRENMISVDTLEIPELENAAFLIKEEIRRLYITVYYIIIKAGRLMRDMSRFLCLFRGKSWIKRQRE